MNCPRCDAPAKTETLREFGGVCEKCLLDFAAEQDAPAFPNLKILKTLGEGGMGVVYKAEQTALGRVVALKVLSPALASDPAFVERFTREAKALAQLSHPNIVSIYESGVHEGVPYLVMEYVEGVPLRKVLKKLDPARALEIVPQICDALAYAHSRGVIHRDIKPENILLDAQGRVKIADFGLAKLAEPDQTRITRSNVVMGTPHYMAPEQMENPGSVDHRADLFSLGVVFYEMLTGELPLGRFKAPSERADVDRRLDPVVLKSLERSPEDRWQSAEAVKEGVTRLEPAGPTPLNRIAVASLVCLILAAGLGAAVGAGQGAAWASVFKAAAPLGLAAFVLAIAGIQKAPKVNGRRVGLFPAIFTLCSLGGLALAFLAVSMPEERPGKGESALVSIVLGMLVGAAGWYFMEKRSFIQTAWFLLAATVGLAILSIEKRAYREALALASMGTLLGANVLAIMGLVSLRGRPAPGQKVAGWAVPVVTLFLAGGLVSSSAPALPAPSSGNISIEREEEFRVDDLWPRELPAELQFGTDIALREALAEAGVSLGDAKAPRLALALPGRVIMVGIDFETSKARLAWENRSGPPQRWNERRLACQTAVIHLIYPGLQTAQRTSDILWRRLRAAQPVADFRKALHACGDYTWGLGSAMEWPKEDVVIGDLRLGPGSRGADALRMSGFPQEMLDDLDDIRYTRDADGKLQMIGLVFKPAGVNTWLRHLNKGSYDPERPQSFWLRAVRASTPPLREAAMEFLLRPR